MIWPQSDRRDLKKSLDITIRLNNVNCNGIKPPSEVEPINMPVTVWSKYSTLIGLGCNLWQAIYTNISIKQSIKIDKNKGTMFALVDIVPLRLNITARCWMCTPRIPCHPCDGSAWPCCLRHRRWTSFRCRWVSKNSPRRFPRRQPSSCGRVSPF